jgi:ribose transport system ATP-binding protein
MGQTQKLLDVRGLSKRFPGVKALDGVNLYINENEIVGLIGENGAGKSTFLNILCGLYPPDEGEVLLHGKPFRPGGYHEATLRGISRVYQEQALVPNIPVYENMMLSHEELFIKYGFFLDKKKMIEEARKELNDLGLEVDPAATTESYDFSVRQIVEIAKACSLSRLLRITQPLILLDEPTSALTQEQIYALFQIVRRLKTGASFIFVSHRLTEVVELSDRIYVLKDGQITAMLDDPKNQNEASLHRLMVGRDRDEDYYKEQEQLSTGDNVLLQVRNFCKAGVFSRITFELKSGEILGIGGVLGSGKSELGKAIAGILGRDEGELVLEGRALTDKSFDTLIDKGIGYVPAERNLEGIITDFSVTWNISLPGVRNIFSKAFGLLNIKKEQAVAQEYIKELGIKTPSATTLCLSLSGGNQQKVLLSKWLCQNPKLLILDNPTRGVDAGAKEEIYGILRKLIATQNISIILISDELLELIGMSNRILIMKDGALKIEVASSVGSKPSEEELVGYMV